MKNQKGFSLIEIFISLIFIGGLLLAANAAVTPWLASNAESKNIQKMKALAKDLERVFILNNFRTEVTNLNNPRTSVLTLSDGSTIPVIAPSLDANGRLICNENQVSYSLLSRVLNKPVEDISRDGYNNSICIFSGQPVTAIHQGIQISYTNIYLISPGKNRVVDLAVNPATNELLKRSNQASDDYSIVVSGFDIQRKAVDQALQQLDTIGEAYGNHFTAQYLADPNRDTQSNYFCRPASLNLCNTSGNPIQATALAPLLQRDTTVVGIPAVFVSPFKGAPSGSDLMVLKNQLPDNILTSRGSNPASELYFVMPNGAAVQKTIVGTF